MIEKGIKGRLEMKVTEDVTASHIGSGTVRVLATPMMIALMERTSRISVKPYIGEGQETKRKSGYVPGFLWKCTAAVSGRSI